MVNPNQKSVVNTAIKQGVSLMTGGLIWPKKVSQGPGCGALYVPKELIGRKLIMVLLPLPGESLHEAFLDINNRVALSKAQRKVKLLENKKKKLEEAKETPADPQEAMGSHQISPEEQALEDDDAY